MAIKMVNLSGNPFIGVFCRIIGDVLICPVDTTDEFMVDIKEGLGLKVHRTSAGNTNLHGSLVAANSKGLIAPYFYSEKEIERTVIEGDADLESDLRVVISDDPITAWGNNLLLSERYALVNPDLTRDSIKLVENTFDVEVVKGTIAGIKTIGSIAAMNSKGMVVHPRASEKDLEALKELFSVDVNISTANFGSPYLGASIIANDRGALVGSKSSGVELNRIENSLDIID
ncbi:MAG: translation initiation factor IF-6 [Candidatus Thermoplasmatota archaeon]|nr:translation initiation factor IF-6 [Candidatus Thermoplasmatota archaeon]